VNILVSLQDWMENPPGLCLRAVSALAMAVSGATDNLSERNTRVPVQWSINWYQWSI